MESADRAERREAFLAWAGLYEQNAVKLDELFDKLIKVRVRMAHKLHFDSYTSFAYLNRNRMDYTAVDAARFRDQVRRVVVPACVRIRERQAARIGVEKLKYYDETFMFPEGNADPIGSKDDMIQEARAMYRELSPETAEFFDSMVEHELFDLETRPGKHLGGYCSSLPKYKVPFIFSNFNGTSADVDVLTHEAGHAFEYYVASRTQVLAEYAHSTSEINEIHSMSMEHFTYPWMVKFFGDKADVYRYAHLCNALTVIPYLVAVDEFQHRIYEKPEMTADERRAVWHEIEQIYLPWRDYDGMAYMEKGGFWMQKQHIFVYPFYYIEYALAQMGAFAFYGKMKTDRTGAWADYLRLCQAGGSLGYFELLKLANLPNPFAEGSVEQTVAHVIAEIESSPWH
jgi:M3 family oligoendopeptidase